MLCVFCLYVICLSIWCSHSNSVSAMFGGGHWAWISSGTNSSFLNHLLSSLLLNKRHPISRIAHHAIWVSFYLELLGEFLHGRIMCLRSSAAISCPWTLGSLWNALIHFKVAKVTWWHIAARSWSSLVAVILFIDFLLHFHWAHVFIGAKDIPHIATVITWVISSRSGNFFLMSIFIDESVFAGAPVGSSGVWDCRDAVLSILVDFGALTISARSWDIVFNVSVNRFYLIV